jgi:hypothetical protein
MSKSPMPRSLPPKGTPQEPHKAGGAVGAGGVQQELFPSDARLVAQAQTPAHRIADLYAFLRDAVQADGGVLAFTVASGSEDEPDVSRRLRRGEDSKGKPQRAFLDFLGFLDLDGRDRFLHSLNAAWGYKPPVPRSGLTDAEKVRLLARAIGPEGRRMLEDANHLPAGSLEP